MESTVTSKYFNIHDPKFWVIFGLGYAVANFAFVQISFIAYLLYKFIMNGQEEEPNMSTQQ